MKKKIFPTLIIAATSMVLAACNNGAAPAVDRTYVTNPTSVILDAHTLNLYVGKSQKVTPRFAPAKAYNAPFTVSSSNESVATVSEDGTITAVSGGIATITFASTTKPEVKDEVVVYATESTGRTSTRLDSAIQAMFDEQGTLYPSVPETVSQKEIRHTQVYKNGVLQTDEYEDSVITASTDRGYIYIGGTDFDVLVEGGSLVTTPYAWIFYCDEDYNTHLYHENFSTKTMLNVATQAYLGQGRIKPLYAILDTMFSSGSPIVSNIFKNSLSTDELTDYSRYKTLVVGGGVADGLVNYELEQNNYATVADYDDEHYSNIPYGTKIIQDYYQNCTWEHGVVRDLDLAMVQSYKVGNDNYERHLKIHYSYTVDDEVTIELPNNREYTIVDDLFDL